MAKSRDLFDDSTMSFGEHLEVLRIHLWKALLGTAVCVVFALFIGNSVVDVVRAPIDKALARYGAKVDEDLEQVDVMTQVKAFFGNEEAQALLDQQEAARQKAMEEDLQARETATFVLEFKLADLVKLLHDSSPEQFPKAVEGDEKTVALNVQSNELGHLAGMVYDVDKNQHKAVTLQVQEAFMTYLKVAFITGFVLSSPWVFYQIWLFVAAGLYPHERRYVYIYLPVSLFLFFGGALFCFYLVFPLILNFLLGYNKILNLEPQIRLSEWVSFALMLPLMFGLSFQLPLIMLFLDRIGVFTAQDYRDKRRFSILVIAFASMVLTPAEPYSMVLMMVPMLGLYELGILLCEYGLVKRPLRVEAEG